MAVQDNMAQEVFRELAMDPRDARTRLNVQVIEGRLVLTGVVDTVAQKEAAERAARRVAAQLAGAIRVENNLTVAGTREGSDRELQEALDRILAAVPGLPPDAVGARVERGIAFLMGHVTTPAQSQAALAAARELPGLKDVVDQTQIAARAPSDPVDLVNRVVEALNKDRDVERWQITASADVNGAVTLEGEVGSELERNRVVEIARDVPGVRAVVSRLGCP